MAWLVFRDNATRSGEIWSGKTPPEAGVNVPKESKVIEFNPQEDKDPWSYKLDKDALIYDPPLPAPPPAPTKDERKQVAYESELGGTGNQLDALYKGLSILIPALAKAGILTADEVAQLSPNKEARPDTPAGWLGRITDIKERISKE